MSKALRLLALAAIPCASFAQPVLPTGSVQVYGLMDVGAGSFRDAGGARTAQVLPGGMTASYLGFRGKEDLGGGLYALFTLESYMRLDVGAAGRSATDSYWGRVSIVGLGGSWGLVRMGRMGSPLYNQAVSYNPLGNSFAFSPAMRNLYGAAARIAGDTAWNNAVGYNSPVVAGFSGTALYSFREADKGNNVGGSVQYVNGPVAIAAAAQTVKVPFTTGAPEHAWQLAGTYDFQWAKLFAQWTRVHEAATATASANTRDKIAMLGASVPVGPGAVLASWSRSSTTGPVPTSTALNYRRTFSTVGYDYYLSKRTDLYAMVMTDHRTALTPGSSAAVGMRHTF